MKSSLELALRTITVILSLGFLPSVTANYFAQNPPRPITGETDRSRADSEADLERRIWNLRALSEQPRQPARKQPSTKQSLAALQKDFTRLQIANKSLLRVALGSGTLDPKFVLKSVTEIRECAERLNKNLALPDVEKTTESAATNALVGPQQLKRSVIHLGTLIFSFIDNPFFKEISVVDTQLTVKARQDLEAIIELSRQIKKNNEK